MRDAEKVYKEDGYVRSSNCAPRGYTDCPMLSINSRLGGAAGNMSMESFVTLFVRADSPHAEDIEATPIVVFGDVDPLGYDTHSEVFHIGYDEDLENLEVSR